MIPDRNLEDTREPPDEPEEGDKTKEELYWEKCDYDYDNWMDN